MVVLALLIMLLQADWFPPSRQMPAMPPQSEPDEGWRVDDAAWFVGQGEGLREIGIRVEGGPGRQSLARFTKGLRTVATWSDRNGDSRADLIEIYDASGAL